MRETRTWLIKGHVVTVIAEPWFFRAVELMLCDMPEKAADRERVLEWCKEADRRERLQTQFLGAQRGKQISHSQSVGVVGRR